MPSGWAAAMEVRRLSLRDGDAYYFQFVDPAMLDDKVVMDACRRMSIETVVRDLPHLSADEVEVQVFTNARMREALESLGYFDHPTGVIGDPAVMIAYYRPREARP